MDVLFLIALSFVQNLDAMKRIKFIGLVSLFILISTITFAQGSATGCLVPSNRVYTSQGLLGTYNNSPSVGLSMNYCSWAPTTGAECYVCNTALNVAGVCLSASTRGIQGTFTMVICDFDKSSSALLAFSGVMGVLFIRRRWR